MSASPRVVIASNRLPFCVRRNAHGVRLEPTSGGLAAALAAVHGRDDSVWIGWPGDCSGLDQRQRTIVASELRNKRVVPVELTSAELSEYYDGTCNGVLWPVLHYLLDRVPVTLPDFQAYRAVNERFAEAIVAAYRPGDVIWIHDYHLLLTPALVRAQLPRARLGFFLHTPFPSPEIFRVLPWRRELIEGLLGATLVGFQTGRDAANFAASVPMLTDDVVGDDWVMTGGRQVRFGPYPIGIDPGRVGPPGTVQGSSGASVEAAATGRRLLLGIDRLDYTKGIPRRLAAFEQLLTTEPELRGRVELFQLAVPSRDLVPSYISYKQEVEYWVGRVNDRFATADWTPVRYLLGSLSGPQLRAMYAAADVMLVTSLRDGMNLVAKEFVAARADEDGVLILSEFAGASEELVDALIVNPYAVDDMARAIGRALRLDRETRRRRMRSLRQRVGAGTVDHWVERFMADLADAARRPADRPDRRQNATSGHTRSTVLPFVPARARATPSHRQHVGG